MNRILRCVSWVAVSSEEQARDNLISMPNQRKGNREFIESIPIRYPGNIGVLVEELSVTDSRNITLFEQAIQKYPAYARLREMIDAKSFDVLVAHKWDRIGRTESLVIGIRDLCLDNGIALVVREAIPGTLDASVLKYDEGYRISGIFGAWGGARERREIGRRSKEGRTNAALLGKIYLGKWPYGYEWKYNDDGSRQVVINPLEAEVVRMIFDMYLNDGKGCGKIAEHLRNEGIRSPRGKPWSETTVYGMIGRADFYAGTTTINRKGESQEQSFIGPHEPLITVSKAIRVREEIKTRERGKRPAHAIPASCICGYCGNTMVASSARDKTGRRNTRLYARCKVCNFQVNELPIAEALRVAIQHVIDLGADELLVDAEPDQEKVDLLSRVDEITALIKEEGKVIDRLLDALESGQLTVDKIQVRINTKQKSIDRLTSELALLETHILEYEDKGTPETRVQEIQQAGFRMLELRHEAPVMVRQWLRRHFRITLTDEIQILVT